jgi:uncharacterized protein YbjT (DUF2867 family)
MYVVFGANGRAGGETAKALLERGKAVRVVVRRAEHGQRWQAQGAEVALASMDDVDAVRPALRGAAAAFLFNPPPVAADPYEQTRRIAGALAEAARREHLAKAVVLSSVGAQHETGTGIIATLHHIEAALAGIASAVTFLRPGYFVETWEEVAEAAIAEGTLPSFLEPDQKIPMVSTIDVGQAAAQLMREDWSGTRIVELGGPEDWSARDVAVAFAQVLGRPVAPAFVPSEQRTAVLADAGLPRAVADALLGMYEGIASGRVAPEHGTERRRGTTSLPAAVARIVTRFETAA